MSVESSRTDGTWGSLAGACVIVASAAAAIVASRPARSEEADVAPALPPTVELAHERRAPAAGPAAPRAREDAETGAMDLVLRLGDHGPVRGLVVRVHGDGRRARACATATVAGAAWSGCAAVPATPDALARISSLDVEWRATAAEWKAHGTAAVGWGGGAITVSRGHVEAEVSDLAIGPARVRGAAVTADVSGRLDALAVTGEARASSIDVRGGGHVAELDGVDVPVALAVALDSRGGVTARATDRLAARIERAAIDGGIALTDVAIDGDADLSRFTVAAREAGRGPVRARGVVATLALDGGALRLVRGHAEVAGAAVELAARADGAVAVGIRGLELANVVGAVTGDRVHATGTVAGSIVVTGTTLDDVTVVGGALRAPRGSLRVEDPALRARVPELDYTDLELSFVPEVTLAMHGRQRGTPREIQLVLHLDGARVALRHALRLLAKDPP